MYDVTHYLIILYKHIEVGKQKAKKLLIVCPIADHFADFVTKVTIAYVTPRGIVEIIKIIGCASLIENWEDICQSVKKTDGIII